MVNIDGSLYTQSGCLMNNKQKKKKKKSPLTKHLSLINPAFSGFLYTHAVIFRNSSSRESLFTSQHLHSRERWTSCEKRPQFYSYLM